MDEIEQLAKEQYENLTRHLQGHHCPTWEGLSELMRQHLMSNMRIALNMQDPDPGACE